MNPEANRYNEDEKPRDRQSKHDTLFSKRSLAEEREPMLATEVNPYEA